MHRGKVIEIGAPYELLVQEGIFADMVKNTGKNA
jgi:ABC-type multidrug transport system fused ATPase/permease subunit